MNPRLSTKILRPDFQGEFTASILAAAASPDLISFAGGLPNPVSFPVEAMDKATHKVLEKNGVMALQYSSTQGYLPLREWVAKRYETMGVSGVQADDIIITNGSQQVLTMMGACMLDPGDKVIVEDPTYLVALQSFHFFDPEILPVTINPDGIDCDALAAAVAANPDVKFAYVIPNFQNPTGRVTSLEKRKGIYELACKYNVAILEDDPYGELRISGESVPSLKSMDTEGRVLYAGSFSKILAPGFRVGYLSAPKELVQKVVVCKQVSDVHTNIWAQIMCSEFLKNVDLQEHLEGLRKIYRHKCTLMADTMEACFSKKVAWKKPEGGLFIWCTLPDDCDMPEFCKKAVSEYKIAVVPGNAFLVDESQPTTSFRLNFSTPTDEQIVTGITILGRMTKELFSE